MDRAFAEPLCIPRLARIAEVSEAHFIRTFRDTFGETPHRYLLPAEGTHAPGADLLHDGVGAAEQFWRSAALRGT